MVRRNEHIVQIDGQGIHQSVYFCYLEFTKMVELNVIHKIKAGWLK